MFGSSINNKGKKEKNKKILEGPCIFPFQYKWKKHDTCYDTDKGPICATSVSKYGTLKKYGYCVESKSKTRKLKTETFKKKIVKEPRKIKKPIKIGMMKLTKESPKKSPKESPKESLKESPKKRYNEMLIQLMGSLHKLMISKGEPFRARAYQKAEETLMNIDTDITSIAQLKGKPGIGETILNKCKEYIETGTLKALEREKANPIHVITQVYGIGPKKAQELISKHDITTIAKLREHPELLNKKQKIGLQYYEDILKRIPRSEIDEYERVLTHVFNKIKKPGDTFKIVGSYRRGALNSGDIDIIVSGPTDSKVVFNAFLDALIKQKILIEILSRGATKSLTIGQLPGTPPRRLDFLYSTPSEYPFAVLYFTGSKTFNTVMRQRALNLGYTMNEHGLYTMIEKKKGDKIKHTFSTERDIFKFLGLQYKTPIERTDGRAIVVLSKEDAVEEKKKEKVVKKKEKEIKKKEKVVKKKEKETTTKKKKKFTIKKGITRSSKSHVQTFTKEGICYLHTLDESTLSKMLRWANKAYYNESGSGMSDGQYDILKEYMENKYPQAAILRDIGAPILKQKVTLPYYMGSMDKIKPDTNAVAKWKHKYHGPYVLSAKLDGISGMYSTEHGTKKLYTRGNGREGQDISYMIPYLKLPEQENITIRGELIMMKKVFNEKYKATAANARNLVAGIANRKKINPDEIRNIDFVAYEVIEPRLIPSKQMDFLEKHNVVTVIHKTVEDVTNELLSEILVRWRDSYAYEIDGIICANDKLYERIKGNPKHAFAFKMVLSDQVVEAKVVDVIWTASKDGYLKPRVRIEPVTIRGAKIEYVTAFNGAYVEKNKIGIGAVIQLIRSGDVIPHILEVITPAPEAKMPSVPYKWNATHVDVMLLDAESDKIVQEKTITAFFTRLGVDKLSAGNVRRMIKAGYASIPAILRMTKADMLTIPGFKEKLATCIYTSIHDKLDNVQLPKLMAATNLFGRGMGEKRIVRVLEVFPHIVISTESENEKIKKVSSIKGFATKTAVSFVRHIPAFLKFIKETGLEKKLRMKVKSVDTSHPLYNKKILLTGFRDIALEEKIKEAGGMIASSVSKNTNLVLVKDLDEDTGKAEKARALGVTLMLRDVFIKKYAIQL